MTKISELKTLNDNPAINWMTERFFAIYLKVNPGNEFINSLKAGSRAPKAGALDDAVEHLSIKFRRA
jgi:hypothetical protein